MDVGYIYMLWLLGLYADIVSFVSSVTLRKLNIICPHKIYSTIYVCIKSGVQSVPALTLTLYQNIQVTFRYMTTCPMLQQPEAKTFHDILALECKAYHHRILKNTT